ncbi:MULTISPECIES: HNH endonuclease signature motif containing protein [Pseudonocardia]|uniref:DUF222 domain-containing protein n=2 Tax=Pseudonocardia TaxID=1847 RepID=A0A1Y2MZA1_PSEAH|nr:MULTISPECIES: HNH endonuclease signature motif containing protein [Pseudonocardia]OSY40381.1 hypothetical protein BG845_02785 [Pseudonocardia autotrophica]TDN72288.1 uncharacterized protein DUF222 [Pseudonocardia autotrophica]BBG03000.1 HNH endonuclease [Pseudonocardia autotrophica]GEC25098.1 HNH endonuclease [Pseudonocardia saturnea]
MTAVHDPPLPDISGSPAFPHADLALVQLSVELAAHAEPAGSGEAELIDQIAQLQTLQNSIAALQTARIRAFARAHVAGRTASGHVEPEKLDRSVRAQVALATRTSPTVAATRFRVARDLHDGLDLVRALHAAGELSADAAAAVAAATDHLDRAGRTEVDRRLAAHDLTRLGLGRIRDLARSIAAQVAPQQFRDRAVRARAERRVTVRPAPDGMAYLSAYLPLEQAVSCLAALNRAHTEASVAPEPLTRGRGQFAADTLVERLTGAAHAGETDLQLQVLVPLELLVDPDSPLPVEIPGYGPVPADLLATARGRLSWRRLVTRRGTVVGGESRQRCFTGLLAEIIRARTRNRCAEPYCDAPIRHIDHIRRVADGGVTDLDTGRGVCEFHNHVREQPGWAVEHTPGGITTTTPTGHTHPA